MGSVFAMGGREVNPCEESGELSDADVGYAENGDVNVRAESIILEHCSLASRQTSSLLNLWDEHCFSCWRATTGRRNSIKIEVKPYFKMLAIVRPLLPLPRAEHTP